MSNDTQLIDNIIQNNTEAFPLFSVAMCVYGGDNSEWFDLALNSVINQTVKPSEVVIVVDGPIPKSIQMVIEKYKEICEGGIHLNVIYLEVNSGHGNARRICVDNCSTEIIALMDADDISLSDRFERELSILIETKADVIGGNIAEFIGNESNIVAYRCVPEKDSDIKEYLKKRCPFNQVSVMLRKKKYVEAGGYIDWYCDEDYYLWIRMLLSGAVFANTGTTLVCVRVGKEMYQRRGGKKYFKSEAKLQRFMLKKGIITVPRYLVNIGERFILQVMMPNKIRGWVFQRFARC